MRKLPGRRPLADLAADDVIRARVNDGFPAEYLRVIRTERGETYTGIVVRSITVHDDGSATTAGSEFVITRRNSVTVNVWTD